MPQVVFADERTAAYGTEKCRRMRLKHTDVPASVETTLKLNEEPQADTARYDRLNTKEVPHV